MEKIDMHYGVNTPTVISETIGGETIIVNLSTGSYYSLEGTAVEIWEGVGRGESSTAIVAHLASRYTVTPADVQGAVAGFLDELEGEGLIVGEASGRHTRPSAETPISASGERTPFAPPSLHKFTDMQDIILLDPVHEVDDRGWPHAAPERSAPTTA